MPQKQLYSEASEAIDIFADREKACPLIARSQLLKDMWTQFGWCSCRLKWLLGRFYVIVSDQFVLNLLVMINGDLCGDVAFRVGQKLVGWLMWHLRFPKHWSRIRAGSAM
jgi:hypothetical protein